MTDEVREQAFDLFFSSGKQLKARGVGLGLSIALAMARDCGGFILLGDRDQDGFTVSLLIPRAEATRCEHDDIETADSGPQDVPEERVLIVDDEEPIVELFKLMLESVIPNIKVDTAHNGREAIDAFTVGRHKVIVMDLHMPVMDGQTAFKMLLELCATREWDMPGVVFCTGYAPPAGVKQAISGNKHHDLLHKPVTTESLVRSVKDRLSSAP